MLFQFSFARVILPDALCMYSDMFPGHDLLTSNDETCLLKVE